jgi:hypothetical protein
VLLDLSLGVRLVFTTNQHITHIILIYARSHSALGLVLGCATRFHNNLIYNIYSNNIREITQCAWPRPWVCGLFSQQIKYIPYIMILYARSHSALGLVLGWAARFHTKPTYNIYYNNIREVTHCSWTRPWVCDSFSQLTNI